MLSKKRFLVLACALLINLGLGIIYAWSIIKEAIESSIKQNIAGGFNWDISSLNDPYSVSVLAFSFSMIFAGKMQDKIGPRITIYIGGLLISAGLYISAVSTGYALWILGFGLLTGTGIGFCYSAITPATIKWFPPEKTGLITGLVVAGFGLSSVYLAPLLTNLIKIYGIEKAIIFFTIGFSLIMLITTFFLKNPDNFAAKSNGNVTSKNDDLTVKQILKTGEFYKLWVLFFISAGAGLMVISFITEMVKKGLGEQAFWGVIIIAIGNAGGRVISGFLSDKIGRLKTFSFMLSFQMVLMFLSAYFISLEHISVIILLIIATFIGSNYGSNLTIFPAISKDKWGLKNFGANYGILFSAWGIGGFVLSRISQMLKAQTGSLQWSFLLAGTLLIAAFILLLSMKEKK